MTLPLLVTPGAVRLQPGGAKITDDELLLSKIRSASAGFRSETKQRISRVDDDVVTLDGGNSRVILLPELPVVSVAKIEVDGVDIGDVSGLWNERGIIRRAQAFPANFRSVRVTYTHGYDPVPEDIQEAVALEVIRRAGRQTRITQATAGPFQVTYGVTETWSDVVGRYRLRR